MPSTDFDHNAYLNRIGLDAAGPPDLALLTAVIARHTATIPFENLDIVLGRPIRLDLASLQAKLVAGGRGGYCHEQNTLLAAALERLGFRVVSLMARVVRGTAADAMTPRTHMMLRVDLPEGPFVADVGFGNLTPTAPLRLDQIDAQATGHETYRLQPLNGETLLQARIADEWENVYRFADLPTYPIDHEVATWFTSTRPGGLFTANVVAARPGTGCRKTLFNNTLTVRAGDAAERFILGTNAALRDALHDHFGIDLDDRTAALVLRAAQGFSKQPADPRLGH